MSETEREFTQNTYDIGYSAGAAGYEIDTFLALLADELGRPLSGSECEHVCEGHAEGRRDRASYRADAPAMAAAYGPTDPIPY